MTASVASAVEHRIEPVWIDRVIQAAMVRLFVSTRAEDHQKLRMRTLAVSAGTSLLATGLLFVCYVQGALTGAVFLGIAAAIVTLVCAFYAAFRTGLNLRAVDPSLTLYQMTAATLVVCAAMYAADGGGPVFVILLLMTFLFGVLRLTTRKLLLFAGFVLAATAGIISLRWHVRPQASRLNEEFLQWLALTLTLPWFALMGGYVSGLRARLRKSNAELQQAVRKVRANEAFLAKAQRIAGLGSWSFDPAQGMPTWSEETYRIFGVDPGQPVPNGDRFLQHVHPDDRDHYRRLIRPALCEGRSFDGRFRIMLPAGGIRWVQAVGEPVIDGEGRTVSLNGTVTDVTERKAQEDALTRARNRAAAAQETLVDAIESLTEAFALFDADDRLVLCNSRYAETFTEYQHSEDIEGLRFEDLVRSSIAKGEVIPPAYANDVDGWVAERVRRHRKPTSVPAELELGGGRWLQVTERHTKAGGIVGVRRDITERKQTGQRQAMEHAVTRLLARSESAAEAIPAVIQTICETLGWEGGARWRWDATARLLRCSEAWSVKTRATRDFLVSSAPPTLAPGAEPDLVRRVWQTGDPLWIADLAHAPGSARGEAAAKAGLRSALAVPIRIGSELEGVLELYTRNARAPDAALLRVLDSVGLQVGLFIARKAAQEQLQQLAHFDYLTGLPNRNLFNQLLSHALAKARRRSARLAILFIDLDGFKQVNDTWGHDAGDHLLATFAERLKSTLRGADVVARPGSAKTAARLGGDEFVVLIEDAGDRAALESVAKRILAAAAGPFDLAGATGRVTASIGISVFPANGESLDMLVKAADAAMYAAKQAGKNAYRFYAEPGAACADETRAEAARGSGRAPVAEAACAAG